MLEIVVIAVAVVLVFAGFRKWKEKREDRLFRERRERQHQEWLQSPGIQRLMSNGPDNDPDGKRLFEWLRKNQGKTVSVEYQTEDVGEPLSVKWTTNWTVPPPMPVDMPYGPALKWELPKADFTIPKGTYHDATIEGSGIEYRVGRTYAWDHHGEAQGLSPAASLSEVENWQIYRISLGR